MPLLDIDTARETFDHSCVNCKRLARGLSLARDMQHTMPAKHLRAGTDPATLQGHEVHLLVKCSCGSGEFFMDLGPEHADPARSNNYPWRAQQMQWIRAAKAHKGLPLADHDWSALPTPQATPQASVAVAPTTPPAP